MLGMLFAITAAHAAPDAEALARGVALRNSGNLQQAIEIFRSLRGSGDEAAGVAATGQLGATLLQARRLDEAEPLLREAYEKTVGSERARHAIELGNLAATRRLSMEALRFYTEARTLAGSDPVLALVARIDEVRLVEHHDRPARLEALSRALAGIGEPLARARMRLSVGTLASGTGSLRIAYENLEEARNLAAKGGDPRIEVEALDGLAQLYEERGRATDALQLSRRGIARAEAADGTYTDILLRLEWRQGRLLAARGANDEARAAYQRAIEHIESIRQDIPIDYEDGRSSFRDTLEPIYLGFIDLLLKKTDTAVDSERIALLRRTRDIAELIKQSELQDYLGERCSVDSVQNEAQTGVAPGTAIFYPIVLKDRIEVIFESGAGISRYTTAMDAKLLRDRVTAYAQSLRYGEEGYRDDAIRLYDVLIRPFEKDITDQGVHTLLVVPDGVLRLLPWTALHDGQQFLVQKYSVVINSGLSMTNQAANRGKGFASLVAGMAEPGPTLIEKLSKSSLEQVVNPKSATRSGFALKLARGDTQRAVSVTTRTIKGAKRAVAWKEELALPGVKAEIDALSKILPGTNLLDATFTTGRLHDEFDKGEYRIAHLATHGFFGKTGDQSYLMAYDDIVTMDGLQKLLQLERIKKNPIDLLTLSACETAEGDDRSPLGIAGAAIKAKAKSVLGTLWPVSDQAAQKVMISFYGSLVHDGASKAEALRLAQVALIGNPDLEHPYYWAPFIIVGNWR
jgi:CHAT domain-containing protein/predicted negative regulator of RcsB-dependent stress response